MWLLTRLKSLTAGLMVFALLLGACSSAKKSSATPPTRSGGVFRIGISEPATIDPSSSAGSSITANLFDTLVRVDAKTSLITPGVATTWGNNADCTEWTFQLRPATTFSNGEPVTAQSFIDGMTRSAAKDAASDIAEFMSDVSGYDAIHGTKDVTPTATTFAGLSAPDPATLVVKLSKPNCEFYRKTVLSAFDPVPSGAGKVDPNSSYAASPVGNGPFMMREPWQHGRGITLVRNPAYSGTAAHLAEVDFTFVPAADVVPSQYRAFQAGQVDYALVPYTLAAAAKATYGPKGEFLSTNFPGTSFLVANVKNPPLDNADARQAISYAIDRDGLIAGIFKGFNAKATSLIPPALPAYYQPGVCRSCVAQDVGKARQLAMQGGMPPGTKLNLVYHPGVNDEPWVQAVAQQLKDVLGLDVSLQSLVMPQQVSAENDPAASGLFRVAWEADYPSGDDFLRPTLSTAASPPGDNHGRYQNQQFDALLDKAVATPDEAQRADLIKQAEQIAIGDDQAVIPLWYRIQYDLFSDKFKNVGLDWFEGPDLRAISAAT